MPRNVELSRTEADFLIDLLEESNPEYPNWRYTLSNDVRKVFGYPSIEEAKRVIEMMGPHQPYTCVITPNVKEYQLKSIEWTVETNRQMYAQMLPHFWQRWIAKLFFKFCMYFEDGTTKSL